MPAEQPTPILNEQARELEREIIYLLTDPDGHQPVWTLEDLARELGEPEITAYTRPLQCAGLIHCTPDGVVFASRAAVRQVQLVGHGVV
jgi:hypothetical protein